MREIQPERIRTLNGKPRRNGSYVLYWMQASMRVRFNHALEYAVQQANEAGERLLAAFGLMDGYPEANARHYRFLLEGLQQVERDLGDRGIGFALERGRPDEVALRLGQDASMIVCDRGYLRHQAEWRARLALEAPCKVMEVESDVAVPVDVVSDKAEFAARTIRPKIHRETSRFLIPLEPTPLQRDSAGLTRDSGLGDVDSLLRGLDVDRSVAAVNEFFRGGRIEAEALLDRFLGELFTDYAAHRNKPETNNVSHMSIYLHFGQISPVEIALAIRKAKGQDNRASYLEELLVRRELAFNFVRRTQNYDHFECLPEWARKTLGEHRRDERETVYSPKELEQAATHDSYWNAAMREMKITGFMHNYMRMYWGKKILEWSASPEEAYATALTLNNKYFLDGRDPNSYANVGWIFGLHDRAFTERPVLGKIRWMSAKGLERKCNIKAYVRKVEDFERQANASAV